MSHTLSICLNHVPHMPKKYPAYEWGRGYRLSRPTYEWLKSRVSTRRRIWTFAPHIRMNHMSPIWLGHVPHMTEWCPTSEWGAGYSLSHHTNEWLTFHKWIRLSRIWTFEVKHMNESRPTIVCAKTMCMYPERSYTPKKYLCAFTHFTSTQNYQINTHNDKPTKKNITCAETDVHYDAMKGA